MNKNKGDAGNIAGFLDLENKLTMNNDTLAQTKTQFNSPRDLSGLPRLPERKSFNLQSAPTLKPSRAVCAGCSGRLDQDNQLEQSTLICRACMVQYAKIDAAFDEASKRKRRDLLEKLISSAEANR